MLPCITAPPNGVGRRQAGVSQLAPRFAGKRGRCPQAEPSSPPRLQAASHTAATQLGSTSVPMAVPAVPTRFMGDERMNFIQAVVLLLVAGYFLVGVVAIITGQ